MELQSCSSTHFIRAIRGGLVVKVLNMDSHGSPGLKYKTLKDVYEGEDAKRRADYAFDYGKVKREIPCFRVVDRSLRDVKLEPDVFVPSADDGSDSDLDDKTTLKQLKKRVLSKKRKFSSRSGEASNRENASKKPVQDDSDLDEPLIIWIPKKSKYSKAIRKCVNRSIVSTSTISVAVKSEQDLVSDNSPQVGCGLAPVRVKVEVPDAEELGCQNNSSIGHKEVQSHGDASNGFSVVRCKDRELQKPREEFQECVTNYMSYDRLEDVEPVSMLIPSDDMSFHLETIEVKNGFSVVQCENREELIVSREDCQNCVTNYMSYDHLEDAEPVSMLISSDEMSVNLEIAELGKEIKEADSCRESPYYDDENSDVCMLSKSSPFMEEISEQSSSSSVQVADMAVENTNDIVLFEDKAKEVLPHERDNFIIIPEENSSCSQYSITSLKTDDIIVSKEDAIADEQPLTCLSNDINNFVLNSGNITEGKLLKNEEKQTSASPITAEESPFSTERQTFDSSDRVSTLEQHQPPERLPSTRKAISPSSQEQLCLAMNLVALCNKADQFKCKEKLFEKQTGEKTSPVKSDIDHAKITVNGANGNLERCSLSSAVHKLNTGCMSIKSCSESAIAFSQRQMHDMESLAVKLMNELKSMTGVVEQKLLFEAYRSVSLKTDADGVKSAIKSAKKMEKMAQKWISVMARDSNRFCKIMELTPDGIAAAKHAVPSKKRKIVFADEAGGKLCNVKLFENDATSPLSDDVNQ